MCLPIPWIIIIYCLVITLYIYQIPLISIFFRGLEQPSSGQSHNLLKMIIIRAIPQSIKIIHQLALVSPFGHVSHLIRVILRSFQISYFFTDVFSLFFRSFSSHEEGTMNKVVDPFAWDLRFQLSFSWAPYIIF